MTVDPTVLAAIVLMALATFATRAGGLWLLGRITISPKVESGLQYLPGTILISLVAPCIFDGSVANPIAAVASVAVAARTRSLPLAMVTGVVVVWLLRSAFGH
jgi:uncharacterized membrane protein